jgi:hypothetical protein
LSESDAPKTFEIPGLGLVTREDRYEWYTSQPVEVPVLGQECRLILEDYAEDNGKAEFHVAIANFLHLSKSKLSGADEALFRYYKDYEEWWIAGGHPPLKSASEAWAHVTFGREPAVTRRAYGDEEVYVSVECECAWEEKHGLQLVFKNGLRINKLGSYDGHLTNSDAYADGRLEDVIYHPLS